LIETYHDLMKFEIIIWLFPIIFMFHGLEEIITIESFIIRYKKMVPEHFLAKLTLMIKKRFGYKSAQLAVSMGWILIFISLITFMSTFLLPINKTILLFTAIFNVFFLQAFSHIGQSIIFRGYSPGIITALLLVIPYSFLTYCRLFELGFIDWQIIFRSIPLSILMVPILLIGNFLGQKFIR
jgi:hypothetical protein